MALKRTVETLEAVGEKFRALYEPKDGKFVLSSEIEVEGTVDKSKLDEFRTNNVALLKERDELKAQYAGVDPVKYAELSALAQKAKADADAAQEAAAKKAGEWDKLMTQRTKEQADAAKAEYQAKLDAQTLENKTLRTNLEKLAVEQAILTAAAGTIADTASEDILSRARSIFSLDASGNPVAKGPDGQLLSTADGSPLTIKAWVELMKVKAPHLFKGSSGGGATNNANSGAGGEGPNPFAKATWNLTQQGKLLKTNSDKARQLASLAGVKL